VLNAQTGALAFTGAETAATGSTLVEPTCAVAADCCADWSPDWLDPVPFVVADEEPPCWPAFVEVQDASTQTGAFAFTGAETAAAGSTLVEPTCAVAADCCADWSPAWLEPELEPVVADAPPFSWEPAWLLQVLATQTAALTFAGASTDAVGDALPEPTWTVPTERLLDCPPSASAGPAVARAISSTPSA
jgi:hypothetical protein